MEHPVNPFENITTFEEGARVLMDLQALHKAKMAETSVQVAELAPEPVVAVVAEQPVAEVRDITSAPSARKAEAGINPRRRALASVAASVAVLGVALGMGTGRTETAAASTQEVAMDQLGFLPSDGTLSESYDNPATTQVETIADREIVFFAEQAPEGSNYWGPEGEKSAPADALTNMLARDIVDPTSLVGHREEAGLSERMTPEQRDELVNHYINDREAFAAAQEEFANYLSQEGAKISFSTFEGKHVDYYTMYMKTREAEGLAPTIHQSKESMQGKIVLRIDLPGTVDAKGVTGKAQTLYYKIDCGYQPVSPVPFENVPELPPEETPTTSTTTPETTTSTTSTTTPETSTTTSTTTSIPETTTTTSTTTTSTTSTTVPETTTTTSTTVPETTTSTTTPETTTTTTIPPKEDDGEVPGEHNEPGEPDDPGEGPAEQEPGEDGYLPGEVPVTPPETPPTTVPTTTTTVPQSPATTSPAPSSTNPPVSVTTVVPTTVPEDQMPQLP